MDWARALVAVDHTKAQTFHFGNYTPGWFASDRQQLGLPGTASGITVSWERESVHDGMSLEYLTLRSGTAIVRRSVPVSCRRIEGPWFVAYVDAPPTATVRRALDRAVTGLLTGLASDDASLAAPYQSDQTALITGPRDLVPLRGKAFGSTAVPREFKLLAINEETDGYGLSWFATALVRVVGQSGPATFTVDLSGGRASPSPDATPTAYDALRRRN